MDDINQNENNALVSAVKRLELVWRRRFFIVKMTSFATLVAIAVSLMLTKYYVASTTVLPDLDFLSGLKGRLAGLQDLAGDLGLGGGAGMSPSQLYPEIIQSETILKKVIYQRYQTLEYDTAVNLLQYWGYDDKDENKNFEQCLKRFRDNVLSVSVDRKTTIISISIETEEPNLSAQIANGITSELDLYQRTFRKTSASEQRKFLETRLQDVFNDLKQSEDHLKEFRIKNRLIAQSPQLILDQVRLEREVTINNAIFLELKKQYEFVKLDEIKNTPVVSVLDKARSPAKKDKPRRIVLVLLVFIISLISSIAWIIFQDLAKEWESTSVGFRDLKAFVVSMIGSIPLFKKLLQ